MEHQNMSLFYTPSLFELWGWQVGWSWCRHTVPPIFRGTQPIVPERLFERVYRPEAAGTGPPYRGPRICLSCGHSPTPYCKLRREKMSGYKFSSKKMFFLTS